MLSRRYASRRYAGGLGPSRIRTRIPTTRQLGQWVSLRKTLRFRVRLQLSKSRCLSLLLAMSGRIFLFLPPRGHEPPPTLRDRLNPNLSPYRHRFPIPRFAKRPDVALYTVSPFFLLPTPSSTHCALKVSEHDSLWQPPAAHSEERSRPQKSSRAQRWLNALAPGYLKGTLVRGHPVVWSLALRSDDAKQDPVVYGTKFGVVFLAEGPRTASIQKCFDCFGLYHPGLTFSFFPPSLSPSCLVFCSRDVGLAVPPRVAPSIFRLQGESGAYSQAPLLPPAFRGGAVLYCTVLCCAVVLYCAVLYCTVLYASFDAMSVGTNSPTCGFNWQCINEWRTIKCPTSGERLNR